MQYLKIMSSCIKYQVPKYKKKKITRVLEVGNNNISIECWISNHSFGYMSIRWAGE